MEATEDRLDRHARELRSGSVDEVEDAVVGAAGEHDHAVIVVAEGAGQNLFDLSGDKDKSGNKKLNDIGILLKNEINKFFKEEGTEVNVKYFDPSYNIRSRRANANDRKLLCGLLGGAA